MFVKMAAETVATRVMGEMGRLAQTETRFYSQLAPELTGVPAPPHTVMHGDAHPGNVYFRNGAAGLLDWQAVRRGHPSRELAYTLVTSVTPADRRAHERELLDEYRRVLAASGGPELDRDDLWERYRQAALYAYVAALITAGMSGMQAENIAMEGLTGGPTIYDSVNQPIEAQDVNEPLTARRDASEIVEDTSTRHRILVATAEVLGRSGQTKLSLSEVALQAEVSRPTLYRWFASKGELLDAFGVFEREMFDSGISRATADLRGTEKLDAALRFIVEYQQSYSGVRLVDIEPEVVIAQLARIIPVMRARLQRLLPGANGGVKAATAIRVAVSHYIVRSDDGDQFLAQLRHAVGIRQPD